MINGVRQFKLINALGREYDMTRPDALLHAPDGLGWGTERTVNRLGMTYIGINEKEIHQSPSGEMVFRTYEEYGRFLSFCQQGGLVLCYKPIDTWYYCEALISIQKSEIQWENNHLICPVQFTLLSYWYEKVVAQTAEPPEPAEPNYSTVTGDPAVFNARYSYPIKELTVDIQGSQDLNGYDKPWVGGAGKNKMFIDIPSSIVDVAGLTFTHTADTITLNGTATGTYRIMAMDTPLVLESGKTYTFSAVVEGENPRMQISIRGLDSSNNELYRLIISGNTNPRYVSTYALSYSGSVAKTNFIIEGLQSGAEYDLKAFLQLEQGSTATDWTPYENICPITSYTSVNITQTGSTTNTYTVELTGAGNVYKGTLDVTSGELVVSWGVFNPNWFIRGNINDAGNGRVFYSIGGTTGAGNQDEGLMSSVLTPTTYGTYESQAGGTIAYRPNTTTIIVTTLSANDTKRDMLAWWESIGEVLYYKLATPITYQLTPTQLSNLIGSNTIQADAGAVTVTYRTDARTEYKIYPYQYSYKYGDTAQNVFDISCDLPSYFKLTIFGERTNPSWRVVQNGSIVKSGKLNATIGSSQKLVINTDPKNTEIALYTLSNTRINNLYGYSDFATERIFALPQGESQVQVLTEDEQSPKVMIEVLKHV